MTRTDTTTTHPARSRRNLFVVGGVVALAVIVGILSAMVVTRQPATAGDVPSLSPTPVVTPSPTAEPSEQPVETPEPSEEPMQPSQEPQPAPSDPTGPTPVVEMPDGVLAPGSIARVLVESIKIRTGPTTEAMLLDSVEAGELVIIGYTYLSLGFGPVEADGFVWYPVFDTGTSDLDEVHPPQDGGNVAWMAVGNGTELWVEPVAARCSDGDPDLATIESLLLWERLACFGDRQITLEGTFGCGGCGGSIPGTFEPYWLASPMNYDFLTIDPDRGLGPTVLHFAPDGPTRPEDGSILRVTGHYDDPRSSECVVAPGEPAQDVHPSVQELFCRSQFVVDSFEVIGFDEGFPMG